MRRRAGRPSRGMCPEVLSAAGDRLAPAVTTLLVRREADSFAPEFRHLIRRTHDPRDRREAALALLAERYYQYARDFSDLLTATFAADSALAADLVREGRCVLAFDQDSQRYTLPCSVQTARARRSAPRGDLVAQRAVQPAAPAGRTRPRLRPPLAGGHRRPRA